MFITDAEIAAYADHLRAEERSPGTVAKYTRDLAALARFLDGKPLTHESSAAWKVHLLEQEHKPNTVNAMLAAVNGFCRFFDLPIKIKFLKVQHQLFRTPDRELTKTDYDRLLAAASGPDGAAAGNPLRHRRPGQRSPVFDGGGGESRANGHPLEGQNSDDPAAEKTLPKADRLRQGAKNRLRRDFSHQRPPNRCLVFKSGGT